MAKQRLARDLVKLRRQSEATSLWYEPDDVLPHALLPHAHSMDPCCPQEPCYPLNVVCGSRPWMPSARPKLRQQPRTVRS